jgi:hypothetical protein
MANSLFTIGGLPVTFAFPEGDPGGCIEESVSSGQPPVATVQLQCPWAGRYYVWKGMLGTATGGAGSIYRQAPMTYWDSPNLVCVAIAGARPIRHTGITTFSECRFTATFTYPTYNFPGQQNGITDASGVAWTTTRIRVSAQVTQVPLGTFVWTGGADSGKAVPEAQLGITVPHTEISITRHLMPYLPISEAESCVGTVNSNPVTIGNRTYANGELLFAGMSGDIECDVSCNRTFKCDYTMLGVKGHTWNQILDRQLTWQTVNTNSSGTGNAPFASTDFWNILP